MTTEELRITVAPGVELRALASGLDQTRTPFVLVHGLASNARMWDAVAAELTAAGHPVVWIDQRGHGQSGKPDDGYDFATIVNDLVVLIGELGFRRPVVVGQSWGGNVVLELAATHPDIPGAVVAVDGGFIELASRFDDWAACKEMLTPPHLVGTPATSMERWMREGNADWPETGIVGDVSPLPMIESKRVIRVQPPRQIAQALRPTGPDAVHEYRDGPARTSALGHSEEVRVPCLPRLACRSPRQRRRYRPAPAM